MERNSAALHRYAVIHWTEVDDHPLTLFSPSAFIVKSAPHAPPKNQSLPAISTDMQMKPFTSSSIPGIEKYIVV